MLNLDDSAFMVIWIGVSIILFAMNNNEGSYGSANWNPNGANSAVVIVFLWTAFWFAIN
jgi:hypothetical protein